MAYQPQMRQQHVNDRFQLVKYSTHIQNKSGKA